MASCVYVLRALVRLVLGSCNFVYLQVPAAHMLLYLQQCSIQKSNLWPIQLRAKYPMIAVESVSSLIDSGLVPLTAFQSSRMLT